MTTEQINSQYDEMIAEITGDSAMHDATRKMIEEWRARALAEQRPG